jgi:transposase-like protein
MTKKHRIAKEIKDEILKRVKEGGVPVSQAAKEHGISDATIYSWLTKGTSGNPSWAEVTKLKKENKELMEIIGELTVKFSQAQKKS